MVGIFQCHCKVVTRESVSFVTAYKIVLYVSEYRWIRVTFSSALYPKCDCFGFWKNCVFVFFIYKYHECVISLPRFSNQKNKNCIIGAD